MKGLAVREQKGTSVGDKIEARLRRAQPAGCLPRLENTHTSTHQLPKTEGFRPQLRPSWLRAHTASLAWATPPPFQAVILPEVLMLCARPGSYLPVQHPRWGFQTWGLGASLLCSCSSHAGAMWRGVMGKEVF